MAPPDLEALHEMSVAKAWFLIGVSIEGACERHANKLLFTRRERLTSKEWPCDREHGCRIQALAVIRSPNGCKQQQCNSIATC